MKLKYILAVGLLGVIASCNVLDKKPLDMISDAQVWNDETLTDAALTELYNKSKFNTIFDYQNNLNVITDEARTCFGWSALLNDYTLGVINPDNQAAAEWISMWDYEVVRMYNEFIQNISKSEKLSEEYVARVSAEARFLRAFHYYNLVIRYGGVPLITVPQSTTDENLYPSRASEEAVYNFILTELDEVAAILPGQQVASNIGHATKWAALALKSRAMLNAACVAKYGKKFDGTEYADILGIPSTKADFYFTEAQKAAKAIIDGGKYSLFKKYDDKAENYRKIFIEENNCETIFAKKHLAGDFGHQYDHDNLPLSFHNVVYCVTNPTLEMVDEYELVDGTPGSEIDYSRYCSTVELYKDKEPRFHATILYNGAPFMGKTVDTYYFTVDTKADADSKNFDGYRGKNYGKDTNGGMTNAGATQTGFTLRKWLTETPDPGEGGFSGQDFIVFRYAEVLLNYAEASFELNNAAEALSAVNQVRERAGVQTLSSVSMDAIRHERKVELAFEGIRYWDVRRWRTATEDLSGVFHRLNAFKIKELDTFGYEIINCQGDKSRLFKEEFYYLPIRRGYITENPNLKQNPNYN